MLLPSEDHEYIYMNGRKAYSNRKHFLGNLFLRSVVRGNAWYVFLKQIPLSQDPERRVFFVVELNLIGWLQTGGITSTVVAGVTHLYQHIRMTYSHMT